MFSTVSSDGSDPSLAELVQYSTKVSQRKTETGRKEPKYKSYSVPPSTQQEANPPVYTDILLDAGRSVQASYASPLMPLRDRDIQALADWFDHSDAEAIEVNILDSLQQMCPEPCWEDTFEFLQDYL